MPWISGKQLKQLKENAEAMIAAMKQAEQRTVLIDIRREGRVNKFTFARGTEVHQIETMGLISDDITQWKKDLL